MESITQWAVAVWADFQAMSPTAQVIWVITILGFLGGIVFGARRFLLAAERSDSDTDALPAQPPQTFVTLQPKAESPSDLTAMLELIKSGTITPEQGMELARSISRQTGTDSDGFEEYASVGADGGGPGSRVEAMPGGEEERRDFANVVVELATSPDEIDRDIILEYARGDRATALATLTRQAELAGPDGARAWREVAALARPFDQEQAIAALRKATELDPNDVVSLCRLSRALSLTEDLQGAKDAAEEALNRAANDTEKARALIRLSDTTLRLGDTLRSETLAREAVSYARRAAVVDSEDLARARVLANAYQILNLTQSALGRLVDAQQSIERAIRLYAYLNVKDTDREETLFEWMRARAAAAHLDMQAGDLQSAADQYRDLTVDARAAAKAHPQNLWLAAGVVSYPLRRALILDDLGEEEEALALAQKAEAGAEALIKRDSSYAEVRTDLIWTQVVAARVLARRNRIDEALDVSDRMVAKARDFAVTGTNRAKKNLAVALAEDAGLRNSIGDRLGASESMKEAEAISARLAAEDPDDMHKLDDALIMKWKLGLQAKEDEDFDAYLENSREALDTAEVLNKSHPGHRRLKKHLAFGHQRVSDALSNTSNDPDRIDQLRHAREACEQMEALVEAHPSDAEAQAWAADAWRVLAANFSLAGKHEAAYKMGKEVLAKTEMLQAAFPQTRRFSSLVTNCLSLLTSTAYGNSDLDGAISYAEKVVERRRADFHEAPRIRDKREALQNALNTLSQTYRAAKRGPEALERIEEALALVERSSNMSDRREHRTSLVLLDQKKHCLEATGQTQEAERIRKEVLAMSETAAAQEIDLVARSHLAIAYQNEAWAARRIFEWEECAAWTDKAEALHPGLEKHPNALKGSRYQVRLLRAEIASHRGDTEAVVKNLYALVDMAEDTASRHPSAANHKAVLDLRLRLVANEETFLKRTDRLNAISRELELIEGNYLGNQLASGSIADVWSRIARLRLHFADFGQVAPAVSKALEFGAASLSGDNTSILGINSELRLIRSRAALRMDALPTALDDITAVEAVLQDVAAASDDAHVHQWLTAEVLEQRRDIAVLKGEFDRADVYVDQLLQVIERLLAMRPKSTALLSDHVTALSVRTEHAINRGLGNVAQSCFAACTRAADTLRNATESETALSALESLLDWLKIDVELLRGNGAACLEEAEALAARTKSAQEKDGTLFNASMHHLVLGQLGRVRTASEDIAGAAEVFKATLSAIGDFQALAPDWAELDRTRMRVLYDLATVTGDEAHYAAVATHIAAIRNRGRYLGAMYWVADILGDPKVSVRAG